MNASDGKDGFINSKHLNIVTAVLVVFAVLLVCVLMMNPNLLGIQSASGSPAYEEKLFNQSMVTVINIEISNEDWESILKNPLDEEYYRANVTINGETFYAVGIRTKGMTSLSQVASSDSDRYSFKISADKYVDGQSFFGLDKFVINNMYQDPTYMKEYLSYDMLTYIGVPTPLFSFVDVSINGEHKGLYLAVEAMEEDFAARVYGSDYGQLYKPESMGGRGGGERRIGDFQRQEGMVEGDMRMSGMTDAGMTDAGMTDAGMTAFPGMAPNVRNTRNMTNMDGVNFPDMVPADTGNMQGINFVMNPQGIGGPGGFGGVGGGADLVYTNDEISGYSQIFENAVFSNVRNSDFKRVIKALKYLNAGEELETYVDVNSTLRYFAANTALVNLDSYVSSLKHNYYLYEKNGQITILPWDFNLAFGAFQGGGMAAAPSTTEANAVAGAFQGTSSSSSVNFPIDTPVSGVDLSDRPLIGVLLEEEEYMELYHSYLQEIVDGYFKSGHYDESITQLDALIGEYVKNDPTAFYTYEEHQKAVKALRLFGELRAESIEGQLNGTVPSTNESQRSNPNALIDSSSLNMNDMGGMGNMGRAERIEIGGDRVSRMAGTQTTGTQTTGP